MLPVSVGVQQESGLGHLLFNTNINYIFNVEGVRSILFEDDQVFYITDACK